MYVYCLLLAFLIAQHQPNNDAFNIIVCDIIN